MKNYYRIFAWDEIWIAYKIRNNNSNNNVTEMILIKFKADSIN